jgi:tetratricopeptide (TPR) repeat protein
VQKSSSSVSVTWIPLLFLQLLAANSLVPNAGAQLLTAERVSEQLANSHSKQRAGDYRGARDILLQALSEAPDSAPLLDALGSVEQDLGEYFAAERSYLRALSASAATKGDPERIAVLENLSTLYLDTNQHAKGEHVREQLEKLELGALNDHPVEKAALILNVIAGLEHARNRDDEAERYLSLSLLLVRQALGPASVDAAVVRANMGELRLEARQYASAATLFRQAILEIETASGLDDPALIRPLLYMARCESVTGHADEAEALARRAVDVSTKAFGEAHVVTANAMTEQAIALRHLRRKRLARDLEKRAKAYLQANSANTPARFSVSVRDLEAATTR